MKQESYVRLIKEKAEYFANSMKPSESYNGQQQKIKVRMIRPDLCQRILESEKISKLMARLVQQLISSAVIPILMLCNKQS